MQTLGIISFSFHQRRKGVSYPKVRSITSKGHRFQGSSVSNFEGVNSLWAFLNSFPIFYLVLSVEVDVVTGAQAAKVLYGMSFLSRRGLGQNNCYAIESSYKQKFLSLPFKTFERMQLQPHLSMGGLEQI